VVVSSFRLNSFKCQYFPAIVILNFWFAIAEILFPSKIQFKQTHIPTDSSIWEFSAVGNNAINLNFGFNILLNLICIHYLMKGNPWILPIRATKIHNFGLPHRTRIQRNKINLAKILIFLIDTPINNQHVGVYGTSMRTHTIIPFNFRPFRTVHIV